MSAVLLPWRRYAAYFRDRAARLLVGVIAMGTRGLMLALLAVFLRRMVDNAINAGTLALVWRDGLAAVAAAIIACGCALGARWTNTGVTKAVVSRIRDDLMAKTTACRSTLPKAPDACRCIRSSSRTRNVLTG